MLIRPDISTLSYKRQLAKRFDRASRSYDAYADFQKKVLMRLLTKVPIAQACVVMDLGTGTGQALRHLEDTLSPSNLIALDLSPSMLSVARERMVSSQCARFVCADAERLPLRDHSCDLVFSSLAIQWCLSPLHLFGELNRVLKPGGHVVLSTLSEGSMPELDLAWRGIDAGNHVHQYLSHEGLLDCLQGSSLNLLSSELSKIQMWFDSPEAAVHSLKKVGASLIAEKGGSTMPPSRWKAFLSEYEKQRDEGGIPLSYQVSFVVAQKSFNC